MAEWPKATVCKTVYDRRFESCSVLQDAQRLSTLWQDVPLDASHEASQTATRVLAKGHGTILWKCGRVRLNAPVLKTDDPKGSVSSNLTASTS